MMQTLKRLNLGTSTNRCWEYKLVQILERNGMAISLLEIYIYIYIPTRRVFTSVPKGIQTASLFVMVPNWRQPKISSTLEWIHWLLYNCMLEYYKIKMNYSYTELHEWFLQNVEQVSQTQRNSVWFLLYEAQNQAKLIYIWSQENNFSCREGRA